MEKYHFDDKNMENIIEFLERHSKVEDSSANNTVCDELCKGFPYKMAHQKCIKNRNCIKNQNFSNTDWYLLMLRLEEKTNGNPKYQLSFLRFWSQFFHDGDNTYSRARLTVFDRLPRPLPRHPRRGEWGWIAAGC